jgi:hypothetical protein
MKVICIHTNLWFTILCFHSSYAVVSKTLISLSKGKESAISPDYRGTDFLFYLPFLCFSLVSSSCHKQAGLVSSHLHLCDRVLHSLRIDSLNWINENTKTRWIMNLILILLATCLPERFIQLPFLPPTSEITPMSRNYLD